MPIFKPRNTERAKKLRREATPFERELWKHLCKKQCGGYKFSRQMPVGPYICDFLCRSERLVIEIDGQSHDYSQQKDLKRSKYLEKQGYHVLRFTNEEVSTNIIGVTMRIAEVLRTKNIPTPSPSREREGGV